MERVICVLVLYNPDICLLKKVISSIIDQVDCLWISDNTPQQSQKLNFIINTPKIVYKKMIGNVGIAVAQNYGIQYSIDNQYDYLFLLDQDSISPNNIINELHEQFINLKRMNIKAGAIGPRPFNRWQGKDYRGIINKGRCLSESLTEVGEIISSASFIPIENFKKTGLMDADLFIDGVDHEWCWRAHYLWGARFFICEKLKLSHALGEGDRRLFFWKVAVPTPFRIYFQYRNYFILIRRNYVPTYWKVSNGIKYLVKLFYFPLCISPRVSYLKNILRGIGDGIWKA